ncbi:MAG: membrane protein insertase YidC, partial [Chloroflexi bacterium]|nr:membrane protein insertase YidC [Chloroflexota bacterium]
MALITPIWNGLILNPMLNGLIALYALLGRNFGLTIIVFTILVRLATMPLTMRQMRSTKKMTELQHRIKAIQRRYAKDRARLSQETMRLYKEAGVNPVGCIGPLVIQFPIWIGLYLSIIQALPSTPEKLAGLSSHLYAWLPFVNVDQLIPLNSHFLWLDLAMPSPSPILPVLVGISMWVLQKMSTTATADPSQQSTQRIMQWMMPFMFAFFTLRMPSGLPLYWFASNVIGAAIQYRIAGLGGLIPSRVQNAPDGGEEAQQAGDPSSE